MDQTFWLGIGSIIATLAVGGPGAYFGWRALKTKERDRPIPDMTAQKTGSLKTGRKLSITVLNPSAHTIAIVGFSFEVDPSISIFEIMGENTKVPKAKREFPLPLPHDVRAGAKVGPYDFWFSEKAGQAAPGRFAITCKVRISDGRVKNTYVREARLQVEA